MRKINPKGKFDAPLWVELITVQLPNSMYNEIEEEINKAFEEIDLDKVRVSQFLAKLNLNPLRYYLMRNYSRSGRGRKVLYPPLAIAKTLIFQELKGIKTRNRALLRLRRNLNEAKDLGYDLYVGLPTFNNFYFFIHNRIDENVQEIMNFVIKKIRGKCREKDKIIGISLIDKKNVSENRSERTVKRSKKKKFEKMINFLKWDVFPSINFRIPQKGIYDNIHFIDLLTFVAMRNVCTNEGYNLLSEIYEDKKIPTSHTLLDHVKSLELEEIYDMFHKANKKILSIAKKNGRLRGRVDIAIDYTDIMYYGDKNDPMIIETKPKNGTTHAYEFITIKIVSGDEQYTLMALPVNKFSNRVELVEKLLRYAKKWVTIRRLYVDREFYGGHFINLFKRMGIKFIMPAIRSSKIKKALRKNKSPSFTIYKMEGREEAEFNLVIIDNEEGDPKPFATNCNALEVFGFNPFKMYGKRWDIETGYRVKKHNFFPKTTSKNYKVRLFYFLFSVLLYNCWMLTNVVVGIHLYGKIVKRKVISAKVFVNKFFLARINYG